MTTQLPFLDSSPWPLMLKLCVAECPQNQERITFDSEKTFMMLFLITFPLSSFFTPMLYPSHTDPTAPNFLQKKNLHQTTYYALTSIILYTSRVWFLTGNMFFVYIRP